MNRSIKRATAALLIATAAFSFTGCSGSKPSKDEVSKGITNIFRQEAAGVLDDKTLEKLGVCITDKAYDKLSASTLKKIAKEKKDAKVSDKENKIITEAAAECGKELIS